MSEKSTPNREGTELDHGSNSMFQAPEQSGGPSFPPPNGNTEIQAAANQSPQVQQLLALQRKANQHQGAAIQRVPKFHHNGHDYSTADGTKVAAGPGFRSSAEQMSFSKDANLPTPYKVIFDTYDNHSTQGRGNVVSDRFTVQTTNRDRPHSVEAEITSANFDDRNDPITTEIGQMGNDERHVREGNTDSTYDGGHLMGAMVLGEESKEAYNIAPQERDTNRNSYNNTIEQAIRGLGNGTKLNYKVEVDYATNNYEVDQQTLVNRGMLRRIDNAKAWKVVIPTRVPQFWSAKAEITSGQQFDTLNSATYGRSKSTDQDVRDYTPIPATDDNLHQGGAYRLEGNGTGTLKFFAQQYTPVPTAAVAKPPAVANATSLVNPAQYESPPPSGDTIKVALPDIATNLGIASNNYRLQLRSHLKFRYLTGTPLPARRFMLTDNMDEEFYTNMVAKVHTILSHIPDSRKEYDEIDGISLDELYYQAYAKVENNWVELYDAKKEHIEPEMTSIRHLFEELNAIYRFGQSYNDVSSLNSLADGTLQNLYKQGVDMRRRMNAIRTKPVDSRMNKLSAHIDEMSAHCTDADSFKRIFKQEFERSVIDEVLRHTSSLPQRVLKELKLDDIGFKKKLRR